MDICTEVQKPEDGVLYRRRPLHSELSYIVKVFEKIKIKIKIKIKRTNNEY